MKNITWCSECGNCGKCDINPVRSHCNSWHPIGTLRIFDEEGAVMECPYCDGILRRNTTNLATCVRCVVSWFRKELWNKYDRQKERWVGVPDGVLLIMMEDEL